VELIANNKATILQTSRQAIRVYQEKFNSELFAEKLEKAVFKIRLR
jgi:hypothetical protein